MITDSDIKKLERSKKRGEIANQKLLQLQKLTQRVARLTELKDSTEKCYKIEYNNGCSLLSIDFNDPILSAELLRRMIQSEIEMANQKLENFK